MNSFGHFPSGQPILPVRQIDRATKRIFVLGVYASAVHARWTHPDSHPRLIARLGAHSDKWTTLHAAWQSATLI